MNNLILLGSTGSIGSQVLEVIDFIDDNWNIKVLTANKSVDKITKQALKYMPDYVVMSDPKSAERVRLNLKDQKITVLSGTKELNEIVKLDNIDLVINGLVGAVGLIPTLNTLDRGVKLGLANKESLVIGGHLVQERLNKYNKGEDILLPIDSEHNAIFRLLRGHEKKELKNIILTASGGPFCHKSYRDLKKVSIEDALNHPNWEMGNKITIDSATMMNKGLEVIEAYWLFDIDYDKIDVVIHPQSIIHSMIELIDHSIYAEMSLPDMKMPIQYVLEYPRVNEGIGQKLNLIKQAKLEFFEPDYNKFECLQLTYQAGRKGGSFPVVLNAANEVAVAKFLEEKIEFLEIPKIIKKALNSHRHIKKPDIETIIEIDNWTREYLEEVV
ncbi:MAG: 1-deoxy-D-xylulose-5-phosphate reductoisomerase [Halanaerobiales bacterium]|nr:1-deoxy-D-xylulose-5-phosphate reductoisomerase [Halanaerobiales bacterium]